MKGHPEFSGKGYERERLHGGAAVFFVVSKNVGQYTSDYMAKVAE